MQIVSQQLSADQLSPKTFDILLASWKKSTQKNYASILRQWLSFCTTRHFDSSAPFVTSVLNFSTSLYERGIGHSQINKVRSALSVIYPDVAIGKHPLISRFVSGVRNLRSGQVKYPLLWNAQDLINYLPLWHISADDSIQDISRKLVATLACVSAQRVHTLSLIDSRHIVVFDSGTYLYIFSDLKVQRDRPCFVITLPSESESDCLRTVELLKLYLNKTRLIRKDPILFLSCRPPYKPVTTDTLARWIRCVMNDAGIDISVFGAHSVRGHPLVLLCRTMFQLIAYYSVETGLV